MYKKRGKASTIYKDIFYKLSNKIYWREYSDLYYAVYLVAFKPSPLLIIPDEILNFVLVIPEDVVTAAEVCIHNIRLFVVYEDLIEAPDQFWVMVIDGV